MFEFSQAPLTPLELWELVAVVIATLFLAAVAMVGLWVSFGPEPYRENRRLSRIQHIIYWLDQHGKIWRVK